MNDLPDLVWPARGLGRFDPPALGALQWDRLVALEGGLPRGTGASAAALALRGRLRRLRRADGAEDDLSAALRLDPKRAETRIWKAETLIGSSPRAALALLDGLDGYPASLYRGAALMKLRRWAPAARAMAEAGRHHPLGVYLEGVCLNHSGKGARALEALARAEDRGVDFAALHWTRADVRQSLGDEEGLIRRDVNEAMKRFSEYALEPFLGPALRRESASGMPASRRTLRLLDRAARGPRKAWALFLRAELQRSPLFSRFKAAVPDLTRAAALLRRESWVHAYLGRALEAVGQGSGARRALDRAVTLSPDCGWIRAWRGIRRMHRGEAGAIPDLRRAVRLCPEYPFGHAWLGGALRRAGRLEEAGRALETAIRLEPGYEWSFSELSKIRREQRRWREAARLLTEAFEREMKFTWARSGDRAACEAALTELDDALRADRGDASLLAWRAWLLLELGRPEAAARDLERLEGSGLAFAHFVRGELETARGRAREACREYGLAARLVPAAAYLGARGLARYRLGELKGAVGDLSRALEHNGTTARDLCVLGAARLEERREREALEALDKALSLMADYPEALAHRSEALRRLRRGPEARRELAKARRLRPDCPWSALVASRLAPDDVAACAELLKAVERGAELPPRILLQAKKRMKVLASRALRGLRARAAVPAGWKPGQEPA